MNVAAATIRGLNRACVIVALAVALAVVPYAVPASTPPLVQLGPIAVADGTAVLAGTLSPQAAGSTLTVNGHPLSVDASGAFAGSVDLNGSGSIALQLSDPVGGQTVFTIPLTLAGLDGVIPTGVLDSVQQAGVSLLGPIAGDDGSPLTLAGSVLDKTQLAGLTANGMDILGALGSDGSFSVQLPGTTKVVTLAATDTHGTTETIVSSVGHQTLSSSTTAAASAMGVRIVKVRFYKQNVRSRHFMRMVVTVKDRRGLLIRGAKLSVRSTRPGRLSQRPKMHLSGRKGRATFTLRLGKAAFGKRLIVVTLAKTPKAKATKRSAVIVPRAKTSR
jgi:hypothetical protein